MAGFASRGKGEVPACKQTGILESAEGIESSRHPVWISAEESGSRKSPRARQSLVIHQCLRTAVRASDKGGSVASDKEDQSLPLREGSHGSALLGQSRNGRLCALKFFKSNRATADLKLEADMLLLLQRKAAAS